MEREDLKRYSRHLALPDFTEESQDKLKNSKVIVVGAGGLGSPVLHYLTAAGVGTIGIIDYDVVEISNLQRQVIFTEADLGKPKAQVAAERLKLLNSKVKFNIYLEKLTSDNALELLKPYDLIIDGTDNFPSRYLINDSSVILNKPFIYGSVYRFEGQVAVFNYAYNDGKRGSNYRDLFPEPPPPDLVPNCEEGGVIGVMPGIIGTMQAAEAIKIITGIGEVLSDKLLIIDIQTFQISKIKIQNKKDSTVINELIDYNEFCATKSKSMLFGPKVKEMDSIALKELMDSGEEFQLIDVRESYEYDQDNLGGELIPLGQIMNESSKIRKDIKVIIHCRSGSRSAAAIKHLEKQFGFDNLYNLKGGIINWHTKFGY
jgi:adenylyltransferase/sulfurtransferase